MGVVCGNTDLLLLLCVRVRVRCSMIRALFRGQGPSNDAPGLSYVLVYSCNDLQCIFSVGLLSNYLLNCHIIL